MTIILIYRPPKPNPAFISEINELLSSVCTTSANTVILGDLNIHVDTPSRQPAADFLQLLDVLNLKQHVDVPTHTRGHTLDLVITDSAPHHKSVGVRSGSVGSQGCFNGVQIVSPHQAQTSNLFQKFETHRHRHHDFGPAANPPPLQTPLQSVNQWNTTTKP